MPIVRGTLVDDQTRCEHYHLDVDIVAMKFTCCGEYYACHLCHSENADHEATQWPVTERAEPAVLCGVCRTELAIVDYLAAEACPTCRSEFNEGCRLHTHLYFEVDDPADAAL